MIILNISKEITVENQETMINAQNPMLHLTDGDIKAKIYFKTKKGATNLAMEVCLQAHKNYWEQR